MTALYQGRNVCFISARTGWVTNGDQVSMDKANASLIEALSERIGTLSLAIVDVQGPNPSFDHTLKLDKIYSLPVPFSYAGGLMNSFGFYRILKRICNENEILIVQLPFIGFFPLLFLNRPVVYHVCANVVTAAANPVKYSGIGRLLSGSFAWFMHKTHKTLFGRGRSRVLVNGGELFDLYKEFNTQMVISSSITNEDIRKESEIAITDERPLRLVFVGRPSLEKGFDVLIRALTELNLDFSLTIVGFNKEEFQRMLPNIFEQSEKIHERLLFYGYVGWEGGLKEIIRKSDIAIVPSRSEGTPRVVLECMAQGVAVIASRLGGIPSVIEDGVNGLLIESGSPQDLNVKIVILGNDLEYRKSLILRGLETARRNTIDEFASHFERAIADLTE